MRTDASSTAGAIFGFTLAVCIAAALIMLTIKLGMVLFGTN